MSRWDKAGGTTGGVVLSPYPMFVRITRTWLQHTRRMCSRHSSCAQPIRLAQTIPRQCLFSLRPPRPSAECSHSACVHSVHRVVPCWVCQYVVTSISLSLSLFPQLYSLSLFSFVFSFSLSHCRGSWSPERVHFVFQSSCSVFGKGKEAKWDIATR